MWPGAWGHKFPLRKRRCKIFNKLLVDTANMNGETGRESFVPNRCCYIHEFSKCVHKGSRAHVSRCSFTFGCISEYNIKLYIYIYITVYEKVYFNAEMFLFTKTIISLDCSFHWSTTGNYRNQMLPISTPPQHHEAAHPGRAKWSYWIRTQSQVFHGSTKCSSHTLFPFLVWRGLRTKTICREVI